MVLDATVAGASANSYLTVADADTYATADLGRNAEGWAKATVETKEAALARATQEIDLEVGRVSLSYSDAQPLLFPRYIDRAGTIPFIPERIRRATYIQAAFLIRNAGAIDDAAGFRARGLSSFANPDGTGGTLADRDDYGTLAPAARKLLTEFTEGAVSAIIVPT